MKKTKQNKDMGGKSKDSYYIYSTTFDFCNLRATYHSSMKGCTCLNLFDEEKEIITQNLKMQNIIFMLAV